MNKVTPYLPVDAKQEMRGWERGKKPTFARVMEQYPNAKCKNCGDRGFIMVSYCGKGPTFAPITTAKASLYFEGNAQFGKGWYQIERTISYICPHCKGVPENVPVGEAGAKPEVKTELKELAEEKSVNWQDW